jgi:hypothetical protein
LCRNDGTSNLHRKETEYHEIVKFQRVAQADRHHATERDGAVFHVCRVTDFLSQHGIDLELIRRTLLEARNSPGVIPLACLKAKQKADEDAKPDT